MYLLDTNVVSELRKESVGRADRNVVARSVGIARTATFLSVITLMELEQGTLLMEARDPAQGLVRRGWLDGQVLPAFAGRVLSFDIGIARRCARLHVPNPRFERDAMIAATALVHGMTVVTRNVADFAACGVPILDPWTP